MKDIENDIERSSAANAEELEALVYHKSSDVISRLIHNKNLTEQLVVIIAGRKNIDTKILESLGQHARWKDNYKVRLALCRNPKTPQRITLAILKFLKIFDLADLTRDSVIPANTRIKIEGYITERLPGTPLGIKITLAKRASSNILMKLIEEGHKEIVSVCLDSPYMTEGNIYKILSHEKVSPQVVRMIANHPKWSTRREIRWALIMNRHAPLVRVANFIRDMRKTDLKELYEAPDVPSVTKPFIFRELREREAGEGE